MPIDKNKFLAVRNKIALASLLGVSPRALNFFAYAGGKRYRSFDIKKKSGAPRLISAPSGPLKTLQRKLALVLNDIYPAPNSSHGFVCQRSIVTNAERHVRKRIILNLDLEDFFPTIHSGRIYGLFKSEPFGFPHEVASTLAALVTFENKLPQGAPTSPILSNMICFQLDRDMAKFAASHHATYTRYADDITFSTMSRRLPDALAIESASGAEAGGLLEALIARHGFKINSAKTRTHGLSRAKFVTGVKVNEKKNVTKKFTRQLRAMIHALAKFGPSNAGAEFNSKYNAGPAKNYVSVVRGKLAHLKNVKGEGDAQYVHLYNRYASVFGLPQLTEKRDPSEDLEYKTFTVVSKKGMSSGFILNSKYLVTAAHALEEGENSVKYFDFNNFPSTCHRTGRLRACFPEVDIALFNISGNDLDDISLGLPERYKESVRGDALRASGYPLSQPGLRPHITPITVTGKIRNKYGATLVHVDVHLLSGNSGGPVVDQDNRVVGVVSRGAPNKEDPDYGTAFVPVSEILRVFAEEGISF